MPLYLYKPKDEEEMQLMQHVRKHPEDLRESRVIKKKKSRYNRIISIIIASRNGNQ